MLVVLQRQQAQLLSTRALVQSTLPEDKEASDPAIEAYQRYHDAMLPFLDRIADPEKEETRKALEKMVKAPINIDLRPLWAHTAEKAKRVRAIQKMRIKERKK